MSFSNFKKSFFFIYADGYSIIKFHKVNFISNTSTRKFISLNFSRKIIILMHLISLKKK